MLLVSELFYSIQGESSHAGYPCVFIRLAGCNLRCSYCDSPYTYEEPGTAWQPSVLLNTIDDRWPTVERVEITGGEPLLQEGVYPLIDELLARGRRVLVETNGSISLARLPAAVHCIMDVKCPASGMAQHLNRENFRRLSSRDEIKFVLSNRADYDWASELIHNQQLIGRNNLIFSPAAGRLNPADLADWLLADALPIRLQLQLHTLLWPQSQQERFSGR